jgi:hypothetical protein
VKSDRIFFRFSQLAVIVLCILQLAVVLAFGQNDPLPSWNDGKTKQAIIAFVEKVKKPGSPDFVPVPERIATFD